MCTRAGGDDAADGPSIADSTVLFGPGVTHETLAPAPDADSKGNTLSALLASNPGLAAQLASLSPGQLTKISCDNRYYEGLGLSFHKGCVVCRSAVQCKPFSCCLFHM